MSLQNHNPVNPNLKQRVAIVIFNPGQQCFFGAATAELLIQALGR
jgi:hypothetical protein